MMECRLRRGGVVIGLVTPEPSWFDFPWFAGRFYPTEAFENVRALFDEEARVCDQEDWETVDRIQAQLNEPGLELEYPDGQVKRELLMHIEGERVSWREGQG